MTNISDIQLKQSLSDMERSQVRCEEYKILRAYSSHFLATLEDDLKQLTINDQNISPIETGLERMNELERKEQKGREN